MAKTLQTGIKGGKDESHSFKEFGYFLNGIDVTHQGLSLFTPYTRGVSRIWWHKMPPFMKTQFKNLTETFKTYFETGYTAIDGISDVTVDFTDFEGGFAGQRFSIPTLARDDTESITVSLYELTGSPVRNFIDLWVTGTRDIRSGIAHYHGSVEANKSGDATKENYAETNHTGELIYCNLDPTGLDCEYVAMFAHAFPTKVPKSHLNYEKGNRGEAQLDLEFRCTKYESPAINEVGKWYIRNSQVAYNYLDFDPHILDSSGTPGGSGYNTQGMTTYDYASPSKGVEGKIVARGPENDIRKTSDAPKFGADGELGFK